MYFPRLNILSTKVENICGIKYIGGNISLDVDFTQWLGVFETNSKNVLPFILQPKY